MGLGGKLGNRPVVNTLGGIRVQTSLQGMPKTIVYGRTRIAGNLVWYGDFKAVLATGGKKGSTGGSGSGKKGGGQYDYGAAIIIGLCQGPITALGQIWSTQGNLSVNTAQETYVVPGGGGSYTATQQATYLSDLGVTRGDTYSVTANDYGSPGSITLTGTQQTPMIFGSVATGHYTRSGVQFCDVQLRGWRCREDHDDQLHLRAAHHRRGYPARPDHNGRIHVFQWGARSIGLVVPFVEPSNAGDSL